MQLSVIIPCYNAANTIGVQLEALANQCWSKPWEVIVVNNRSTDNSMAVAEQYRDRLPHLRIVDAFARQGRPHALNFGARVATGEALAFCDADDEMAPGWLAAIGEALCKYDFVASRFDGQKLNAPWVQQVRSPGQKDSLPTFLYPPYLPYSGCCGLGVKRAMHELVCGFDESLLYLQEVDYCFRLQLQGVELHFVPEALMYVRLRDTFSGIFLQAYHWAEYNVVVYKKYQAVSGICMPQLWKRYLCEWKGLLRCLLKIRSKDRLGKFLWRLGWQIGCLQGNIKYWSFPDERCYRPPEALPKHEKGDGYAV